MSAVEMQFRTAAFGGFQKQDVLEYIDRTNREHTQQMEALRQELEEASKARLAMEEERAECGRTAEILRDPGGTAGTGRGDAAAGGGAGAP